MRIKNHSNCLGIFNILKDISAQKHLSTPLLDLLRNFSSTLSSFFEEEEVKKQQQEGRTHYDCMIDILALVVVRECVIPCPKDKHLI